MKVALPASASREARESRPGSVGWDPSYAPPAASTSSVRYALPATMLQQFRSRTVRPHAVSMPRRREQRPTRRARAAGRSRSASKSPPGEPSDPPPSLRRLDGGGERSRDSKLNQAWQGVLALDLDALELETLGEYCRIRSVWAGRWAA